jgi:PAS domain S-box-containing protein
MPKKKPIARRLDKLFDEIKNEEPSAKPVAGGPKVAPEEKAGPPAEAKTVAKRLRASELTRATGQTETALALDFQPSPNNWATLQVLDETNERKWTEEDELLVRQVTDQLTLALENARLFQQEQYRRQVADTLSELARIASSSLNINDVVQKLLEQLPRLVSFRTASIQVVEPDGRRRQVGGISKDQDRVVSLAAPSDYFLRKVEDDALISEIVRTRDIVIINDTHNDPRWEVLPETQSIHSWLGAPLLTGTTVVGILILDDSNANVFTPEVLELVRAFTPQAAVAIQNARLFQETQSRAEDLSILNEMGNELSTKLDPKAIAEVIYKYTSRLMDTKYFYIALYDENKDEKSYPIAYENGQPIELYPGKVTGRGFTDHIIRNKRTIFAPSDVLGMMKTLGIDFVALSDDDTPSQAWLGVPMLVGERVLGVISVQSVDMPNLYDSQDREILTAIASQAAIAVENARLFQESQRRAQEMSALAEVGREVSATLDLKSVLEKIAEYAIILLNSVTSAVYLPDPEFKTLIPFAVTGDEAEEIRNDPLQIGTGILGNIAKSRVGEIVNDVYKDTRAITIKGTVESVPDEHLMAVPILLQDRVTGLMAIWRVGKGSEYNETEFNFLSNLAQQAAIAIENARLFQDVTNSQAQLSEALRIARIGYFEIDWIENTIAFTDELFDLLATSAEKEGGYSFPLQDSLNKFVIPDDIPLARKAVQDAIESESDRNEVTSEVRYRTSDGRIIWVSSTYKVERDDKGNPVKIAGSSQDITERKTNELTQAAATLISESALTAKTLEELIGVVHDAIQILVPAKNFYVALYDRSANLVTFPYHVDEQDDDWAPRKLSRGLTGYVIRTGKPLRITPEIFSDLEASGEIVSDGAISIDWLGVPLRSKQVVTGIIAIQTYDYSIRITERHQESLTAIASQVASAIERFLAEREIQKFKLGIDRSDNAVFITDLEGVIQYANPAFEKVYGFTPEEAVGKTPRIVKSGVIPDEQYKYFWSTLLSGGTVSGEIVNKAKDGRIIPIAGTNSPILDESGKIIGFLAVHQDITERKRSEELVRRRNTYLAASAEIGRLVTSTLDINTIFTRTVNLVSDRLGFYFAAIYEVEEEGYHAIMREGTGGAGESMKIQKHRVSVGSQTIVGQAAETGELKLANDVQNEPLYQPNPMLLDTLSEVAIPLKVSGRVLGVIDIQSTQAQAFAEDDLSVLQSLADQVAVAINNAKLYDESQELIKTLKEVDQLKSQFLANMSHELRTPLNSIIGFSRVILKGIDGPVTDMQQQDLTAIYNSGQHLLGLINDILDLARIEAGKMELNFEEVHLSEMVHSVFSTAKGLVKEKPIKLVEQVPSDMPTVRGDTMRVRQVLLNLISNASKFTDEGSITVQTQVQKAPNGKLEALVNVIDTGPGISPEGQEKLFKAFSQVDGSATRKSGGSGLGLSICANLVQLHGGRIGVSSQESIGSTFWFTIPLFNQPEEEIPAGKKVVLAIDDDPQVISLYERYLTAQGYHVVPLTEPARAKERVKELKPFAVTLDIMMPNIDGWTVLTELKSDPATRDIPIIICSIVEQTDKGFNLGAADYLLKPIIEEELVHSLDRLNKNGSIQRVLVIDDDPNDLRLIEKILTEHGQYKAILAEGGRKGWEILNTNPPDAVILDIFMPEMDGFTILEKLREEPALRDIPVLVVSGGGLTNEQQQQLADYGQRLITKGSLKENDLIASIENALKRIGG